MMDCLFSTCTNSDPAASNSRKIDKLLKEEKKKLKRQVKILLLGSGESGKSTFLKQMVIIHGRGEFTAEETREYRQLIYLNIVNSMRVLIGAREQLFNDKWPKEIQRSVDEIKRFSNSNRTIRSIDMKTFLDLSPCVNDVWPDDFIKQTYERRNEFQIPDSCKYFFENLARISHPDYTPTNRDILLSRKATRGITEHLFFIQRVPFRFVDVGGQRSQRQKWFQCFESITSILFLVASNEYDQVLLEDKRTNRVVESRSVFEVIVNNRCFVRVALILFLNKTDLLMEKVTKSDIRQYFPQFVGDAQNYRDVQKFLMNLFDSARRDQNRAYFYHFTTAVDTENIRRVFQDCREVILEQNLKSLLMQ